MPPIETAEGPFEYVVEPPIEHVVERPSIAFRYLSGAPYEPVLHWRHGGLMFTPLMRNRSLPRRLLDEIAWAADNGCFKQGAKQGARFRLDRYLAFLDRWRAYRATCLFAVAPDVPCDAAATWERSRDVLPQIRALGYPAAFAIQNGIERTPLADGQWDALDAVFIAGDTAFKESQAARRVVIEARLRGKHVHIARRNSGRAVQAAYDMGADSVDGTFLAYAPDVNWQRMQRWIERLCAHERRVTWGADQRFSVCLACRRQLWSA